MNTGQVIAIAVFALTVITLLGFAIWQKSLEARAARSVLEELLSLNTSAKVSKPAVVDLTPLNLDEDYPIKEAAKYSRSIVGKSQVQTIMQVVVSIAFISASLCIILSPTFDSKDKHWAYGSAGTILGFWLKR